MFSMQFNEIIAMLFFIKKATLRPYKGSLKGSFRIGSIQRIKIGLFDKQYCFKVVITNKTVINLDNYTDADFIELGYQSKAEYMKQKYNLNNPSNLRIRYDFEIIEINKQRLKELNIL